MAHGLGYGGFHCQHVDEVHRRRAGFSARITKEDVPDNATAFMEGSVHEYMNKKGVEWKAVLPNSQMANCRARIMAVTIKHTLKR